MVVKSRPGGWRKQQHVASRHMHKRGKKNDPMECSGEQVFQETKICDTGEGEAT